MVALCKRVYPGCPNALSWHSRKDMKWPKQYEANMSHCNNIQGCMFTALNYCGGAQKGGFQKGDLGGYSPYQKPERGYMRKFPSTKTGTRVHADVPQCQNTERGHIRQNRPLRNRPFSANKGLPYPLGAGSARPNPKMGAPDPKNLYFQGFLCSEGD